MAYNRALIGRLSVGPAPESSDYRICPYVPRILPPTNVPNLTSDGFVSTPISSNWPFELSKPARIQPSVTYVASSYTYCQVQNASTSRFCPPRPDQDTQRSRYSTSVGAGCGAVESPTVGRIGRTKVYLNHALTTDAGLSPHLRALHFFAPTRRDPITVNTVPSTAPALSRLPDRCYSRGRLEILDPKLRAIARRRKIGPEDLCGLTDRPLPRLPRRRSAHSPPGPLESSADLRTPDRCDGEPSSSISPPTGIRFVPNGLDIEVQTRRRSTHQHRYTNRTSLACQQLFCRNRR
ncbi:hypothetical protein D9611_001728 [Ephemerocybe angulata]|uniref:Uncharacterized protein n=1 Tax=Ephemerocybe angulata TaxID=980116 RepID=A0A8H5CIZ6_9AGAR|nr:hypothetical protein D9611_001728 [Tulosesus angulatus]